MNILTVEVKPKPGNEVLWEVEGAFAVVWVKDAGFDKAEQLALDAIDFNGWDVVKIESHNIQETNPFEKDEIELECYVEAEQEGLSLIFYEWPKPEYPKEEMDK